MSEVAPTPQEQEQPVPGDHSKAVSGADKVQRKADDFPPPLTRPDAQLVPLFPGPDNNVWTVKGFFPMIPYILNLPCTMTVYRSRSGELSLFNALRTSEEIEKKILELGRIANVVKLGQFHGDADAYYLRAPQFQRDGAGPQYWVLPGGSVAEGIAPDCVLSDTNVPVEGAILYHLKGHPFAESVMTAPCDSGGPVLITCDTLMYILNTCGVPLLGRLMMNFMGFLSTEGAPQPAPIWVKKTVEGLGAEQVRGWYDDILGLEWRAFVGAHGDPLLNVDHEAVRVAVEKKL